MNAILKRAGDLKTITERTKSYLWMQMGSKGFRKHEPVELPAEEPTLVGKLIQTHCERLNYGPVEIAKLLHMQISEAMQVYFPQGFMPPPEKKASARKQLFVVS